VKCRPVQEAIVVIARTQRWSRLRMAPHIHAGSGHSPQDRPGTRPHRKAVPDGARHNRRIVPVDVGDDEIAHGYIPLFTFRPSYNEKQLARKVYPRQG